MGLYPVVEGEGMEGGWDTLWGGSQEVVSWGRLELTGWGTPSRGDRAGWARYGLGAVIHYNC